MDFKEWNGFKGNTWKSHVNVRDFIIDNYTQYDGDESFLKGPTQRTLKVLEGVEEVYTYERENGKIYDIDNDIVGTITSHPAGYINKDNEIIFGLQTDKLMKRSFQPFGGINVSKACVEEAGKVVSPELINIFTHYRKTHNQGVFDVYTKEMRLCRKSGVITGLPDAYGRGRIIGDYRRVALYGLDFLINDKVNQLDSADKIMTERTIRHREEISEQIKALKELKELGSIYGFDLSNPASNALEAIQWTYFGYLAAIKQQNGAAMSIGRISTFLDIYIQRDLELGLITEEDAQEMIDQLVIKLRVVRFARTKAYDELFTGDPTWVTESVGGITTDGHSLVTKNSYRVLNTLYNLGPAPEPNLTVLWSKYLPENFKRFASKVSIDTCSIQYENDDLMRPIYGDDYAIACCVSPMRVGKEMQFFGARCNLGKALLYAINGGVDEKLGIQVGPQFQAVTGDYLEYDDVLQKYEQMTSWLSGVYVNALNAIHYMHDKYAYESLQLALHDAHVKRYFATGIAGLSVVTDSLSAIKHAKVKIVRDEETGLAVDFVVEGDYPKYGNNDDRADEIATYLVESFMNHVRTHETYRNAEPSMSILTITSNVVYGKKTGNTPDGRRAGEPFAPGANPMHGRDSNGALASLLSVAKLPYDHARDGISYTFSVTPGSLGKESDTQITNLVTMLDGYFENTGQHINVNVFDKDLLIDAMNNPSKYPSLTIRVSGYAVNFIKLTKEQQLDVINRTIHESK